MVEIAVNKIGGDFQSLELAHQWKVYSTKIIARQLQNQMLDIHKLAEEESFIYESLRPF